MNIKKFFSQEQKKQIIRAIQEAEKETSGEIRIHLESNCKGEALDRTIAVFQKLLDFRHQDMHVLEYHPFSTMEKRLHT